MKRRLLQTALYRTMSDTMCTLLLECNQYYTASECGVVVAPSPSRPNANKPLYDCKDGGGGGARRRSTSALESGVGRGITPVASCHAETRRLDEACRMRGLQRSGSRPASKTKWCLDTRPDVAPGLVHCTVRHNSTMVR